MTFKNQKTVTIKKEPCDNVRNHYARINLVALHKAMSELKTMGEMKLWLYLAKNKDEYTFGLSPADCETYGLKRDAYHTAVDNLIKKGYLQKIGKAGNAYHFIEKGIYTEKPYTI